ncbi:hypothetical protein GQ651_15180 [Alphaproteobacteria bacterium GH1-50]|uniref:DUF6603 domain-containing protein n=1 Tax=Kangsaoukella pontilimi TaxID=2691042 RepID=A0A7C9IHN2_9RHOB|nr:DUF6603 domain-containing protein [Kangsaoukella pontilimi]MXQ09188.1 hypothetical protein [Kangsaoukella pontilimi]
MAEQRPALDLFRRTVLARLGAAGFSDAALAAFLDHLCEDGELGEGAGDIDLGASGSAAHFRLGAADVLWTGGAQPDAALLLTRGAPDAGLDAALSRMIDAHSDYYQAVFHGPVGVDFLCIATFDLPGLTLPGGAAPIAPQGAGVSFSAAGGRFLDALGSQLSSGLTTETLCAARVDGHIPASGGRLRIWETEKEYRLRPLHLDLSWPELLPGALDLSLTGVTFHPTAPGLSVPLAEDPAGGCEERLGIALDLPGDRTIEASLAVDLYYGTVMARLQDTLTMGDVVDLIGADRNDGVFTNKVVADLLDISVSDMWLLFDPGAAAAETVLAAGLEVTKKGDPFVLVEDMATLSPTLSLWVDRPASDDRAFHGVIEAAVHFGRTGAQTELDVAVSIPDFAVWASIKNAPIGSLIAGMIGTEGPLLDKLRALRCDLFVSGDLEAAEFALAFDIHPGADTLAVPGRDGWHLDDFAVSVTVESGTALLGLQGGMHLEDAGQSRLSFFVEAHFGPDGWSFAGRAASGMSLTDALSRILGQPPDRLGEGMQGATLGSVTLSAAPGRDTYALDAFSTDPWDVLSWTGAEEGTLTLALNRLRLAKDGKDFSADLSVDMRLCGVYLALAASYDGAGNAWSVSGRTKAPIDIGALLRGFHHHEPLPPLLSEMVIETVAVSFTASGRDEASSDLKFTLEGWTVEDGTDIDLRLHVEVKKQTEDGVTKPKVHLSVEFLIGPHWVHGELDYDDGKTLLVCEYAPKGGEKLSLNDVIEPVAAGLADGLPRVEIGFHHVFVAYRHEDGKGAFAAGVSLDLDAATVDLSALPIGGLLGSGQIGVDRFSFFGTTAALSSEDVAAINACLSPDGALPGGEEGATAMQPGLSLSVGLLTGGAEPMPLLLDGGATADESERPPSAPPKGEMPEQEVPGNNTPLLEKSFTIGKTIGPLSVSRLGLSYGPGKGMGRVGLKIDCSVGLGPVRLGLNGFHLEVIVDKDAPDPTFGLDGLDLAYDGGEVSLAGGFLRRKVDGVVSYEGAAILSAADFAISGFGAYTETGGQPSLFIFAALHAELGGPPFFRVQGIAAGFGYNRRLTLPAIDKVQDFPLIRAAFDADFIKMDDPATSVSAAMEALAHYVAPAADQYWVAAGIKFSSFEIIQSAVLVTVAFGQEVEIGLLGLSRMSLPRGAKGNPVANIELAIRASYRPADGLLAVEGRLTDVSYVLSKDCKLTGGFAFFIWFGPEHAGQFVVTLGGYAPTFIPPPHFPQVPRLRASWRVSGALSFSSELYFALTPSCIMLGGKFQAAYKSGKISASFVAHAHFLLRWEPLAYSADIGIRLRVAVDMLLGTARAEASVGLKLWGPPLAGEVRVRIAIITFTIGFGQRRTAAAPLTAAQFKAAFLPGNDAETLPLRIARGLLAEPGKDAAPRVDGRVLKLSVGTAIPITELTLNGVEQARQDIPATPLGIRPMAKGSLDAPLRLILTTLDGTPVDLGATAHAEATGVPEALWGEVAAPLEQMKMVPPAKAAASVVQAAMSATITFASKTPAPDGTTILLTALLAGAADARPIPKPLPAPTRSGEVTPLTAADLAAGAERRRATFAALGAVSPGLSLPEDASLPYMQDRLAAGTVYFQSDGVVVTPLGASTERKGKAA